MVNSTDFGKRLQKILDFYGLSAIAFSEAINFNRSTISHLLSGRNKPSLEFVMKVLHKFPDVELYWLLNGKGNFPKEKRKAFSTSPVTNEEYDKKEKEQQVKILSKKSLKSSERPAITEIRTIERIIIFYEDGSFKSFEN